MFWGNHTTKPLKTKPFLVVRLSYNMHTVSRAVKYKQSTWDALSKLKIALKRDKADLIEEGVFLLAEKEKDNIKLSQSIISDLKAGVEREQEERKRVKLMNARHHALKYFAGRSRVLHPMVVLNQEQDIVCMLAYETVILGITFRRFTQQAGQLLMIDIEKGVAEFLEALNKYEEFNKQILKRVKDEESKEVFSQGSERFRKIEEKINNTRKRVYIATKK